MICLLALVIGFLPMQSAVASMGKCESSSTTQQGAMIHDMASTDHMLGHDQSDCFTCVDHHDCCSTGACSSGNCGVSVGRLSSLTLNNSDNSSLSYSERLPQKLTKSLSPHYRPPRA